MTQRKETGKDNNKKKLPNPEELARELSKAKSIDDFYGKEGIFPRLFSETIEQMLEAELSEELGYAIAMKPKGGIQATAGMGIPPEKCEPQGEIPRSRYRVIGMANSSLNC